MKREREGQVRIELNYFFYPVSAGRCVNKCRCVFNIVKINLIPSKIDWLHCYWITIHLFICLLYISPEDYFPYYSAYLSRDYNFAPPLRDGTSTGLAGVDWVKLVMKMLGEEEEIDGFVIFWVLRLSTAQFEGRLTNLSLGSSDDSTSNAGPSISRSLAQFVATQTKIIGISVHDQGTSHDVVRSGQRDMGIANGHLEERAPLISVPTERTDLLIPMQLRRCSARCYPDLRHDEQLRQDLRAPWPTGWNGVRQTCIHWCYRRTRAHGIRVCQPPVQPLHRSP